MSFDSPFINATQGGVVTLDCNPRGFPIPTVVWYKDNDILIGDDRITFVNGTVVIDNAFSFDSGSYSCVASNIAGNSSAEVYLNVQGMREGGR